MLPALGSTNWNQLFLVYIVILTLKILCYVDYFRKNVCKEESFAVGAKGFASATYKQRQEWLQKIQSKVLLDTKWNIYMNEANQELDKGQLKFVICFLFCHCILGLSYRISSFRSNINYIVDAEIENLKN